MIKAEHVTKCFDGMKAVDNVSVEIKEGIVFGMVGTNGAGKSTLLRMISGVLKADEGAITVDGAPVFENPAAKKEVFYISDDAYLAYTQGMRMVVTGTDKFSGTAQNLFRNYPVEVSAKTGTAQTGRTDGSSDNGAFVCYAPSSAPEIAISVYGERAGSGSAMGAVAKAILDIYFEVGQIGDISVQENQMS